MATQPTIVWLKKDLRLSDHAPLAEAAARGPMLALYIYEPIVYASCEFDGAHLTFLNESLLELRELLSARGGRLIIRRGEAVQVLETLRREVDFRLLLSHEETGTGASYQRDLAVAQWAKGSGVEWREFPQTGVVRRLRNREGWARLWHERMDAPQIPAPATLTSPRNVESLSILSHGELAVEVDRKLEKQAGGVSVAHATLEDFLSARGIGYGKGISSPLTARESGSRLSPYLAFGCLSMRQIWQATESRRLQLSEEDPERRRWASSLRAFGERLHWHCHFMQKLESDPRIEFENVQRACDGLREDAFNEEYFDRWCRAQTGYPMIDACLREVMATGWLNFRMRAMVVSFASYDLWLHWRRPAVWLARHFLDFEPGIHYSQFQMQSGTTGINTIRIYNPTKQGQDHDPQGIYRRRWLPELAAVPDEYLDEPWTMPISIQDRCGCRIGVDYPAPVVDHKEASKAAKAAIYATRRQPEARAEAQEVLREHGSRKRTRSRRPAKPKAAAAPDLFHKPEGDCA